MDGWQQKYATREWLNSLLWRVRKLEDLHFLNKPVVEKPYNNDAKKFWEEKIANYRVQDTKNGFDLGLYEDDYITWNWASKEYEDCGTQCFRCYLPMAVGSSRQGEHLIQATVHRMSNDFPHTRENCVMCCRGCNSALADAEKMFVE